MTKMNSSYRSFSEDIARLLIEARGQAARSVNAILTTTYWEVGRRIVHFEQGGRRRAGYGAAVVPRLSADLRDNLGGDFLNGILSRCVSFTSSGQIRRQCLRNRAVLLSLY